MIPKYKTIHILLTSVHLDCRDQGSSDRNASRDESVEARDEFIEAGENTKIMLLLGNNKLCLPPSG